MKAAPARSGRGRRPGSTGSRDYKRLCGELSAGPLATPFAVQPWTKDRQLFLARQALAEKRSGCGAAEVVTGQACEEAQLMTFFKRGIHVSKGIAQRAMSLFTKLGQEPRRREDTEDQGDYVKSMKYIFDTRCGNHKPIPTTWAAEAEIARVPRKSLQERFLEVGALIEIGSRGSWSSICRHVLLEVRQHRVWLRLFLRGFRSDSTPITLRVEDGTASDVWNVLGELLGEAEFEEFKSNMLATTGVAKTKQVAKVIQSEHRIVMMIEDREHKDLHVFGGHVATPLQYADFGSAECLREAERQQLAIAGADADFIAAAEERGQCDGKDMAYSNQRQGKYDRKEDKKGPSPSHRVSNNCRIHRLQTILAKIFDIVAHHISGLVNIALAMRAAGMLEKFLEVLGDISVSRLVFARGGRLPDPEVKEFRDAMADYLFTPVVHDHGHGEHQRVKLLNASKLRESRATFDKWMISDPRLSEIVVYYNGPMTDSMVKQIYRFKVSRAFMYSLLPLFARHRWTGCKSTLQRAAIVFSWCNLGVEVIPAWIQRSLSSTVCKELTLKGAQDITAGAAALQDGYDSDVEDQARLDQKHAAALASSAEVTNTAISLITGSYDWAEHNKTLKCDAAKWAAGDPSGILLVINIGVDAFVCLMHAYLTVSSEKWLKDEAAAAAREGDHLGFECPSPTNVVKKTCAPARCST